MLRSMHPVLLCFASSLTLIVSCLVSDERNEEGAARRREAFIAKLNSVSNGDPREKVLELLGKPARVLRGDGFSYREALCFGKSRETGEFPVLGTVYIDTDGTVSSVVGMTSKLTRHSDQELARIYQDIAVFADLDEGTRHGGVPSAGDLEKSMAKLNKRSTKELLDSLREYARVVPWGMRYDDQNVGVHLLLRAVLDPPAGEYFLLLANRDMFYPQTAEDRANPRFPIKLVDGKPTVIIRPAPFPGVKQVPSIKMDYFLPWYERCQVRKWIIPETSHPSLIDSSVSSKGARYRHVSCMNQRPGAAAPRTAIEMVVLPRSYSLSAPHLRSRNDSSGSRGWRFLTW